jgi:hypothetical protein
MGHIHTAAAGIAIASSAAWYALIGAGPSPLTPAQQCAFTAWRTMMPCNWLGQQVPAGTPGSWG